MGFSLEQHVNFLNTSLSNALSRKSKFSLSDKFCKHVSSGMQASKPIDRIIKDIEDSVPAPGHLKELDRLVPFLIGRSLGYHRIDLCSSAGRQGLCHLAHPALNNLNESFPFLAERH